MSGFLRHRSMASKAERRRSMREGNAMYRAIKEAEGPILDELLAVGHLGTVAHTEQAVRHSVAHPGNVSLLRLIVWSPS